MDSRSTKVQDLVANIRNFSESVGKTQLARLKWLRKYEWLVDEQKRVTGDIRNLCEMSDTRLLDVTADGREKSCLPWPLTINHEYGWLAHKSEFHLEKHGSPLASCPDRFRAIAPLAGDIPWLAAGKPY